MTEYIFPPASVSAVPIHGLTARFPIRHVYCIGRNYAEHVAELGNRLETDLPYFQKNACDVVVSGAFPYPPQSSDVHHEIELAVALKDGGRDIPETEALDCIYGYAIALDMTRRDQQTKSKNAGRPWENAKSFDHAAPMAPIYRAETVGHPAKGAITLHVNGQLRQSGDLDQMIWSIPRIIAYLSSFQSLAAGDLILTGTPAGVGPVVRGDHLVGAIDGLGTLDVSVT